jgi:hypothetical protein
VFKLLLGCVGIKTRFLNSFTNTIFHMLDVS